MADGDWDPGLRIVAAIWPFWDIRGYLHEGHARAEALISAAGDGATATYAAARDAASWLATLCDRLELAAAHSEAAEASWRALGDAGGLAWSFPRQAILRYNLGQFERAQAAVTEGLDLARTHSEPIAACWLLYVLAHAVWLGGDEVQAEARLKEMLAISRAGEGMPWAAAWALLSLGLMSFAKGDYTAAQALQRESLQLRWQLRDMRALADSFGAIACGAAAQERRLLAARLFGAADRLREATGAVPPPWLQPVLQVSIDQIRAALGQVTFDVAWSKGRATPLEEVIAMALADAEATDAAAPASVSDLALDPVAEALRVLTAREREVAALIAHGLTSAEIAEKLVVSERTVDAHADHIRTKLSLRSRAEIAAWATEHGLRQSSAG
jgi:non-specific serine/threonine protein kinase